MLIPVVLATLIMVSVAAWAIFGIEYPGPKVICRVFAVTSVVRVGLLTAISLCHLREEIVHAAWLYVKEPDLILTQFLRKVPSTATDSRFVGRRIKRKHDGTGTGWQEELPQQVGENSAICSLGSNRSSFMSPDFQK